MGIIGPAVNHVFHHNRYKQAAVSNMNFNDLLSLNGKRTVKESCMYRIDDGAVLIFNRLHVVSYHSSIARQY